MRQKILFTIAYDGGGYAGWQRQKGDWVKTVEGEFVHACEALFRQKTDCVGASRTDSGVHAQGQRATIEVDTKIPVEKMPMALNGFLPEDIAVQAAEAVPETFHCRFDVDRKTYEYRIYQGNYRNPLFYRYSEFIRGDLDILSMQRAADFLIGENDFKAFCAAGTTVKSTVRTIYSLDVVQNGQFAVIRVTGDGFLYNMVRIIAGTLIQVGQQKMEPEQVQEALFLLDRQKAGRTAPPQGLCLKEIQYKNSKKE